MIISVLQMKELRLGEPNFIAPVTHKLLLYLMGRVQNSIVTFLPLPRCSDVQRGGAEKSGNIKYRVCASYIKCFRQLYALSPKWFSILYSLAVSGCIWEKVLIRC